MQPLHLEAVGGKHQAQPLYLQEKCSMHCTGIWMGLRAGLDRRRKTSPLTNPIPRLTSMHHKIKTCGSVKIIPCINFVTRCVYVLRHVLILISQWIQTSCSPYSFMVSWKREYFSDAYTKNGFLTVYATVQHLTVAQSSLNIIICY